MTKILSGHDHVLWIEHGSIVASGPGMSMSALFDCLKLVVVKKNLLLVPDNQIVDLHNANLGPCRILTRHYELDLMLLENSN